MKFDWRKKFASVSPIVFLLSHILLWARLSLSQELQAFLKCRGSMQSQHQHGDLDLFTYPHHWQEPFVSLFYEVGWGGQGFRKSSPHSMRIALAQQLCHWGNANCTLEYSCSSEWSSHALIKNTVWVFKWLLWNSHSTNTKYKKYGAKCPVTVN